MVAAMDSDAADDRGTREGQRDGQSDRPSSLCSLRYETYSVFSKSAQGLSRVLKNGPSVHRAEARTFTEVKSLGKAKMASIRSLSCLIRSNL